MLRPFFYLLVLSLLFSCAVSRIGRMYDMNTGTIIEVLIDDARKTSGIITFEHPKTGEKFLGEYTTIIDDRIQSSFGFAEKNLSGYAAGNTFSAYGWANAYGFSFDQPNRLFGAATLAGDKGTVVEIVYAVDRRQLHGYGVSRDNKGNTYRVHF